MGGELGVAEFIFECGDWDFGGNFLLRRDATNRTTVNVSITPELDQFRTLQDVFAE